MSEQADRLAEISERLVDLEKQNRDLIEEAREILLSKYVQVKEGQPWHKITRVYLSYGGIMLDGRRVRADGSIGNRDFTLSRINLCHKIQSAPP